MLLLMPNKTIKNITCKPPILSLFYGFRSSLLKEFVYIDPRFDYFGLNSPKQVYMQLKVFYSSWLNEENSFVLWMGISENRYDILITNW